MEQAGDYLESGLLDAAGEADLVGAFAPAAGLDEAAFR